jgi:hypothetical protein
MSITNEDIEECKLYSNIRDKCSTSLNINDLNTERAKWLEMVPSDYNKYDKIVEELKKKCSEFSIFPNNEKCNFKHIYTLNNNCDQLGIGKNTVSQVRCSEAMVANIYKECQDKLEILDETERIVLCSYDFLQKTKVSQNMQEIINNQRRLLEKNKEYQQKTEELINQSMQQAQDLVSLQIQSSEERLQKVIDKINEEIGYKSYITIKDKIESTGTIDWKTIIIITSIVAILIFIL